MEWGAFDKALRGGSGGRSSYFRDAKSLAWSRPVLWLAVLLYGAHAGASLYEMLVVTPLWANDPPQSVRDWSFVGQLEIRPMVYKGPAMLALGLVSIAVLWLSSARRIIARGWMMLSGSLGVAFVVGTTIFAFPTLERMHNGVAGLTDQQILEEVGAWQFWCNARLVILLLIWAASLVALIRSSSPQRSESLL